MLRHPFFSGVIYSALVIKGWLTQGVNLGLKNSATGKLSYFFPCLFLVGFCRLFIIFLFL